MKPPGESRRELQSLLERLSPVIRPGSFVFVDPRGSDGVDGPWLAWVEEPDGPSAVTRAEDAVRLGLEFDSIWSWITLSVESNLEAVGLTAAVSAALARGGIPANLIAGLRHDHVFVPVDDLDRALSLLLGLARSRDSLPGG